MKKMILDFLLRGMIASGFGPIIWAILYLILYHQGLLQSLTIPQVCLGIFSLSALAFIAGGMNAIYQIERLPLMVAILIHGIILYFSYLCTYLLNGWLEWGITPILFFSGIFILGYLAIWVIIYSTIKKRTDRLNAILQQNQKDLFH